MTTTSSVSGNTVNDSLLGILNGTTKKTSSTDKTDSATASKSQFLTLLTEQLKNQDPTNPVDNAQMTSQLAQINTVDGINQLNTSVQSLLTSYQSSEATQAAALVGRGVLVEGKGLELVKSGAIGGVDLAGPADKVTVQVIDGNGKVVRQMDLGDLDAGSHAFGWDGKTDDGSTAADGKYSIKVTASLSGSTVTANALELSTVTGVVRGAKNVQIQVGNLGLFSMSDIKQILS